MSNIIPKEQMSAYQRWEMETLDDPRAEAPAEAPQLALPTAESIQQIQLQARQEGHQEGYQEGLLLGREQGYGEGQEQARQEAQRLHQVLAQLDQTLERLDREMAQQLLELALGVAKQMLRQALKVRPELVLAVVQEAIASLPQVNQHPQLILHPQDAALVRVFLENELAQGHWHLVEDGQVQAGGCRLETAQSELDATLESRWQRVLDALGQSGDWLAPK